MSTPSLSARLRRIEERLDFVALVQLGLAERLEAARKAHEQRRRRGEPHPLHAIRDENEPFLSWETQNLRAQMNRAGVRMARRGDASYALFADLAADDARLSRSTLDYSERAKTIWPAAAEQVLR